MSDELMRDLVGRRARVVHAFETRGGVKFEVGDVVVIDGHWRGMVHLKRESDGKYVRRVWRMDVQMIDPPHPKPQPPVYVQHSGRFHGFHETWNCVDSKGVTCRVEHRWRDDALAHADRLNRVKK